MIGWAGWDHRQRAQALAEHLTRLRGEEGWDAERLTPLLAGLAELLPWVLQWHNDQDSRLGRRTGDAYADFLRGQLAELGLTEDDLAELAAARADAWTQEEGDQYVTTPLRDLIDIPERVFKGDFVLRLGEGVTDEHAAETVEQYVVTPELAKCFDEALGLIGSALEARSSKAAYLHGSFGSGKSHFMAVLHLLLRHDPRARSLPELAEVVARHDAWLAGKRFLLPTYHLIGARSLEDAVFGGYVEHVARLHPEAPVPAVYASKAVFGTVAKTRELLGDEAFFAALNAGTGR